MQRQSKSGAISDIIIPTVQKVWWFPNGEERNTHKIFEGVFITDGVSIAIAGGAPAEQILVEGIPLGRPGAGEIIPIGGEEAVKLLQNFKKGAPAVAERKLSVGFFNLPSRFVECNPHAVLPHGGEGEKQGFVQAWLANATPGAAKRVQRYWLLRDSIAWTPQREKVFKMYKVAAAQAAIGKRPELARYEVLPANSAVGSSWVIVGAFPTEDEANNYAAYLNLPSSKKLLGASKGGNTKTWGYFLPDLVDYSSNNDFFKNDEDLPSSHDYRGLSLEERILLNRLV